MSDTRLGIELSLRDRATSELKTFEDQLRAINREIRSLIASSGELAATSEATKSSLAASIAPLEQKAVAIRQQIAGLRAEIAETNNAMLLGGGGAFSLPGINEERAKLQALRAESAALRSELERVRSTGLSTNIRFRYEGIAGIESAIAGINERLVAQTAIVRELNSEFGRARPITQFGVDSQALALDLDRRTLSARASARVFESSLLSSPGVSRPPEYPRPTAEEESRGSIRGAITEHEVVSIANAEALATAKLREAVAQETLNRQIAQAAIYQQQALATEHEVITAANEAARIEQARISNQQAYAESLASIQRGERETAEAVKYRTEVEEAQARVQGSFSQRILRAVGLGSAPAASDESIASIAKAEQEANQLDSTMKKISQTLREYHSGAISAHDATSRLGFAFRELTVLGGEFARGQRGQEISTLFATLRRLGTAGAPAFLGAFAAGYAALRIPALAKEYAELAAKTDDAARAAGISVDQYSRLQRILQLSGVDSNRLANAMGQLSQSMRTSLAEPLGEKGSAFAAILGNDFWTQLPKLMEDPIQSIDLLRKKYQDLVSTVGQFQAMGLFRQALGRNEWSELSAAITSTDAEWQKWNKDVEQSHLPFTAEEVAKLREYDLATRKLTEDWESLGKQVAILSANSGFLSWLDHVVLSMEKMIRLHPGQAIAEVVAGVAGAGVGIVAGSPGGLPGMVAGGVAGAGIGVGLVEAGARTERALGFGGPSSYGPQGAYAPIPPKTEQPFGSGRTRTAEQESYSQIQAPNREEAERHPQLYQTPGTTLSPQAMISEAVQWRTEIEQNHRLIESQLEAEKAKRLDAARGENERNQISHEIEQRELQNRAQARAEEEKMLQLYRQRAEQVPEAIRPMVQEGLDRRVGVEIQTEQADTEKRTAEERTRYRNEEFRIFDEQERGKLALVRGNAAAEEQIYQERLAKARQLLGEQDVETKRIEQEHIQASRTATEQLLQDRMRVADENQRMNETQLRLTSAAFEAQNFGRGVGRVDNSGQIRVEEQLIQQSAVSEINEFEQIAAAAENSSEIKIQALDRALNAAESAANQEMQLAKKVSEEKKRQLDESSRAYVQFFNTAESSMERFFETELTGTTQQRVHAIRELVGGLEKDVLHTAFSIGSQLAGQGLAKATGQQLEPGKGVGDLLGNMVGRLVGLSRPEEKEQTSLELARQSLALDEQAQEIRKQILQALEHQTDQTNQIQRSTGVPVTPMPQGSGISGSGRGSWFGSLPGHPEWHDPTTGRFQASGVDLSVPGIALPSRRSLGQNFLVTGPDGRQIILPQTDVGPASSTGRGIDINSAAASRMGYTPSTFPTNQRFSWQQLSSTAQSGGAVDVNVVSVGGTNITAGPQGSLPVVNPLANTTTTTSSVGPSTNPVPAYQEGGPMRPPLGSSDSQLAWLTPGEFIVTAPAVQHYGTDLLSKLNNMSFRGFQDGGIFGEPEGYGSQFAGEMVGKYIDWVKRGPLFSGGMTPEQIDKLAGGFGTDAGGGFAGNLRLAPEFLYGSEVLKSLAARKAGFESGGFRLQPTQGPGIPKGGLTPDEFEMMEIYRGAGYYDINKLLRSSSDTLPAVHQEFAKIFDPIFERVGQFSDIFPGTVYRGGMRGISEPRSVVQDPGYLSTSVSPSVAHSFQSNLSLRDTSITPYMATLAPLPGTKGLDIGRITRALSLPGSTEAEILFPKNTSTWISTTKPAGENTYGLVPPSATGLIIPSEHLDALTEVLKNTPLTPGFQTGGEVLGGHPTPTLTTSGGLTTEIRGFAPYNLQPVYPKTPHWENLLLLGFGVATAAGIAASLFGDDEQKTAQKLLQAPNDPGAATVTARSTTPLSQEQVDAAKGWIVPGINDNIPGHQHGGSTDTIHAMLTPGERVLNLKETAAYHRRFPHGILGSHMFGGPVWPGFQEGGVAGGDTGSGGSVGGADPALQPSGGSQGSGGSNNSSVTTALNAVTGLTSNMSALGADVQKVSSGFASLERSTGQVSAAQSPLMGAFKELTSVAGGLNSIFSAVSSIGKIGSTIARFLPFLGLAEGGIAGFAGGGITDTIPAMLTPGERVLNLSETAAYHSLFPNGILHASNGALVGGLPHFAVGGLTPNFDAAERITNLVQNTTSSADRIETSGNVHNTFNFSGMLDTHGARDLLMREFGTIAKSYQRAKRNSWDIP